MSAQAPVVAVHRRLADGRWYEQSLSEQFANIGSEVGRSIRAREAGNEVRFQRAFDRCLELFDLTLADDRWHGRRREIARAREVVCDFIVGDNAYASTARSLDRYFLPFAARRATGATSAYVASTDPRVDALIGSPWSARIEALAEGILGSLPAGPLLAAAFGEIGRRRERRLTEFVLEVEERVAVLEREGRLDRARLHSEELQDYFLRVLDRVADSQADKQHYFAAALANSMTAESPGSTERDLMLGVLSELHASQLRLLASLNRAGLDASPVDYFTPSTPAAQVLDLALPDVPTDLRRRLWQQMSDQGLLGGTQDLIVSDNSLADEESDGAMTSFGRRFVNFITISAT